MQRGCVGCVTRASWALQPLGLCTILNPRFTECSAFVRQASFRAFLGGRRRAGAGGREKSEAECSETVWGRVLRAFSDRRHSFNLKPNKAKIMSMGQSLRGQESDHMQEVTLKPYQDSLTFKPTSQHLRTQSLDNLVGQRLDPHSPPKP